jgi:16S rRNA (cytosine1402-N4)-methyltransferase
MFKFKYNQVIRQFSRKIGNSSLNLNKKVSLSSQVKENSNNSDEKLDDIKKINLKSKSLKFQFNEKEDNSYLKSLNTSQPISREMRLKLKRTDGMLYEPIEFDDHYPVLWRNVMKILEDNLNFDVLATPKVIGDFTLGAGNHTRLILDNFENTRVVGVDLDPKMIEYTSNKLDHYIQNDRLVIVEDSYVCVENLKIAELYENAEQPIFTNKKKFDFMLLDLGFNSMQLNDKEKGLSFKNLDANLDMRYDLENDSKAKASDILNNTSELELMEIFSRYAEEKNYEAIAKNIIKYREDKKFEKVSDFINVIDKTYEGKDRYYSEDEESDQLGNKNLSSTSDFDSGTHLVTYNHKSRYNIYTRLFQALRIVVNYELTNVQRFLNKCFFNMELGGILAVITFHSAEDKIVKNVFKEMEKLKLGKLVLKKGEKPCKDEIEENSRSHSAILRAIQFNPK